MVGENDRVESSVNSTDATIKLPKMDRSNYSGPLESNKKLTATRECLMKKEAAKFL